MAFTVFRLMDKYSAILPARHGILPCKQTTIALRNHYLKVPSLQPPATLFRSFKIGPVSADKLHQARVDNMMSRTSQIPRPNPWSVKAVLSQIPDPPPENSSSPVPFLHLVQRLKTEKREGWRRFSINHGESIADHMYRMSIITMLAPPSLSSRLDIPRCTKMALVHDMAEALVGDITPPENIPKQEKSRREAETMDYICTNLLGKVHGGIPGEDIRKVWREYEDSETLESHFVHDVDKIELLLQMVEYEKLYDATVDLSEFSWVAQRVALPEMKVWAQEILDERTAFWKSKGKEIPRPETSATKTEHHENYYGNGHAK